MKTKTFLLALTAIGLCMGFGACSDENEEVKDETSKEVAVTGDAYDITLYYAYIRGYANLNVLNGGSTTEYRIGIQWEEIDQDDEDSFYEFSGAHYEQADGLTGNEFYVVLNELEPNTEFRYRSFVYANGIYHYGKTKTFRTKAIPNIASAGATHNITTTTAEAEVKIDVKKVRDGVFSKEDFNVGIAYSTDEEQLVVSNTNRLYASKCHAYQRSYNGDEEEIPASVSCLIYNLKPNTKYYYVAYTEWEYRYEVSEVKSFTTKEVPNIATVGSAEEVTSLSADIEVIVDTTRMSKEPVDRAQYTAGVAYADSREALNAEQPNTFRTIQTFAGSDMYYGKKVETKTGVTLENLQEVTTYYYCAYTRVDNVYRLGEIKSFTTTEQTNEGNSTLIFKSIYTAGGRAGYTQDGYFEIVNNSNKVQYLDQLVLLYASAAQKEPNAWQAAGVTDIYYQGQGPVVAFPGSGTDYPIKPGQSVVIANDATNHKTADPDGIHSDLSRADWEIYLDYSRLGDEDYNAPNLHAIYYNNAYIRAFGLGFFNGAYVLAKLPVTPETYAADENNYSTTPGSTSATQYMGIPSKYVLDAVEAWENDESEHYSYFLPEDDAHAVWAAEAWSGKCIRRKVVSIKNGRAYYKDTNNSYDDFLTNQPQTPGITPTTVDE